MLAILAEIWDQLRKKRLTIKGGLSMQNQKRHLVLKSNPIRRLVMPSADMDAAPVTHIVVGTSHWMLSQ